MARSATGTAGWVAVAAALLTAGSGCAAVMKQAPAENRRVSDPPVCSTGRGGVVLDVLVSIGLAAGAATAIEEDEADAALALALVGGVFVASAISGHRAADKCEEANASFARYRDAERDEEHARRADAAAAAVTSRRAAPPVAPVAPPVAEPAPAPEPAFEPAPEPDREREAERGRRPARNAPKAPPLPGTDAWREFWVEVQP